MLIITQNEIRPLKFHRILVGDAVLDAQLRKGEWEALRLLCGGFYVIFVDVTVAEHDFHFTWLKTRAVGHHYEQEAVRRDVVRQS